MSYLLDEEVEVAIEGGGELLLHRRLRLELQRRAQQRQGRRLRVLEELSAPLKAGARAVVAAGELAHLGEHHDEGDGADLVDVVRDAVARHGARRKVRAGQVGQDAAAREEVEVDLAHATLLALLGG